MNYKKLKKEINETLNFKLTEVNAENVIKTIKKHHENNIKIRVHGEELNEGKFEELVRPIMKYLCENYHPHVTIIITPTGAELLEGLKSIQTDDYIRD